MHGTAPSSLLDPLAQQICIDTWRDKYAHEGEADYDATCARVVNALFAEEPQEIRAEALRALRAREVVPAGRILAGAGTKKRVTLINCFTSPYIQDSMATVRGDKIPPGKGIMDALADAAYSLQMGGGIGMDFSTIRPRGAIVHRTASISSGVLPFMDMWDAMSQTIMSAGHRRGAMMGTLRCDHPDIEEFIEAKQQEGRLENFNVSILVTDAFMEAVAKDADWELKFSVPRANHGEFYKYKESLGKNQSDYTYKHIRARALWAKITEATYIHAEPGVIFIDQVNKRNNLQYCEHIHACNPCGEQMLPDSGACNLGHVNLAVMVDSPFEEGAQFDFEKLKRAATTLTRLLDNVLDVTRWPTEEQAEEGRRKRRIGVGFTGLATALQQLGIRYGSAKAVALTSKITETLARAVYKASYNLAVERGSFPAFDADGFLQSSPLAERLGLGAMIATYGIRNGVLLSIAPTGTTSLVVGNVSSGIEPVFAHRIRRKVRGGTGELSKEYSVFDYGFLKYCEVRGLDPEALAADPYKNLPEGFVTADELTVEEHLTMAAAAQQWIDSAVSKTINCPESMSIEEFREVYTRAYALGLKGCTTYRPDPRSKRGAVLVAEGPKDQKPAEVPAVGVPAEVAANKTPMQDVVDARRYRIKWPTEDCAYYIIITDHVDASGRRRPFELFVSTKSERHSEWVKAFSLLVTAIFRREGDPAFIIDELRSVFSAAGGAWVRVPWDAKSKLAPSLVAAIGLKIEEHLRWLGLINDGIVPVPPQASAIMPAAELLDICDSCGARAVIYAEGCATCHACGRSDC